MAEAFRGDGANELHRPGMGSGNRVFGLTFAAVFALLSASSWFHPALPLSLSVLLTIVAIARPSALAGLNRLWTRFGLLLHRVLSPLVIGLLFFLVITPAGILMRRFRPDPLHCKLEKGRRSYWVERAQPGPDPDSMRQQF